MMKAIIACGTSNDENAGAAGPAKGTDSCNAPIIRRQKTVRNLMSNQHSRMRILK
jgi:hypothetical protein